MGTYSLKEVAAVADNPATLMFQLYVVTNRDFTRRQVEVSLCAQHAGAGLPRMHAGKSGSPAALYEDSLAFANVVTCCEPCTSKRSICTKMQIAHTAGRTCYGMQCEADCLKFILCIAAMHFNQEFEYQRAHARKTESVSTRRDGDNT